MKIKIKKLVPEAVIPEYATPGAAGMDLTAVTIEEVDGVVTYGTGLAMEIPEGHVGLIFPRSSNYKYDCVLANSVGVSDSDYRGEIKFKFFKTGERVYKVGDRVGQIVIVPYPAIEFDEVENLGETLRGSGGFGHTGGN